MKRSAVKKVNVRTKLQLHVVFGIQKIAEQRHVTFEQAAEQLVEERVGRFFFKR